MLSDLAMRAVASSHFRWMPGMLVTDGVTVAYRIYHDGYVLRWLPNVPGWPAQDVMSLDAFREQSDMYMVLEDAATKGCLLALVREAWGDPYVYAMRLNVRRQIWVVHVPSDRHNIHGEGATEAEALVAALGAAP